MNIAAGIDRDLRLAVQSLRRSPGFVLVAVVTLALGIGANAAMFSLFSGYVFEPSPYPDAGRLDRLYRSAPQSPRGGFAPADYLDARADAGAYGELAAYAPVEMSISVPGRPAEAAQGLRASVNLFATLGIGPQLGRAFRPDEETWGNHRVLVLTHRYWRKHFAGDPGIVGRTGSGRLHRRENSYAVLVGFTTVARHVTGFGGTSLRHM